MNGLKGLGTALITPFKADGSVDYDALAQLLDTQLTGFVDYIVVLGTTGEAATMTAEEKRRFAEELLAQKAHGYQVYLQKKAGKSKGIRKLKKRR